MDAGDDWRKLLLTRWFGEPTPEMAAILIESDPYFSTQPVEVREVAFTTLATRLRVASSRPTYYRAKKVLQNKLVESGVRNHYLLQGNNEPKEEIKPKGPPRSPDWFRGETLIPPPA